MDKPADDQDKLIIPAVNNNGTAYQDLLNQVSDALMHLEAAEAYLGQMTPHGRDYLPQGGPDYLKAAEQHSARRLAVRKVAEELKEIARGIQKQRR